MNYIFAAIFGVYGLALAGYIYRDLLKTSKKAKERNRFLNANPEDNRKDLRFL